MEQKFKTQLVLLIKKEMLSKGGQSCQGGGSNGVGFDVISGKEEGKVSLSG